MNDLQVFKNSEFGELGILLIEGKEYFPATACAKVLGYAKPTNAIHQHCNLGYPHSLKHTVGVQTGLKADGTPAMQYVDMNFIDEGNLYRLIVSSKLPAAERFERWVFDEVLPALRKSGNYVPDIQGIITQTATAVVAEVLKQLIPAIKNGLNQSEYFMELGLQEKRPRKKAPGIIDKLDVKLRQEVERMLCTGKYTYSDIVAYLADYDVKLSMMAVYRYAKRIFKERTYQL